MTPNPTDANQTQLYCDGQSEIPGYFEYVVTDSGGVVQATGVSSDQKWAEHDAGGFHTKKDFDTKYGEGKWHVNFAWKEDSSK